MSDGSHIEDIASRLDGLEGADLLDAAIRRELPGRVTVVSSFGAEAAVLLHMVGRIDATTPVTFVDTGHLFAETLRYRDRLADLLGLRDVRTVGPEPDDLRAADDGGTLWQRDADACCFVRKVVPVERALSGFPAWITGRKAYHGGERAGLEPVEIVDGKVKLNPLARWSRADIDDYISTHDLPRHPLEKHGYRSIGCEPCTDPVAPDEEPRAGRWRGLRKSECGIHSPAAGYALSGRRS